MSRKKTAETTKKKTDPTYRPFAALEAIRDGLKGAPAVVEATKAPREKPKERVPVATAEEDALALHRLMTGVTPLEGKATRIPRSQAKVLPSELQSKRLLAEEPAQAEADAVHAHLRALVEGGRFEVTDDGRRVEGRRDVITAAVVRKLRRGLFPIDGRLDLHGQTAAGAQKSLEVFLKAQRARGERCVLVVHGKGEHSPGGVGVLRGEIAAWLSQGAASVFVAAFVTARDEDGGEGATYILLTR